MAERETNMVDVDFDRVLSLLHGWLGQEVRILVDVTVRSLAAARMNGVLGAARDVANPFDHDEYEFTVGASAGFALHRDYFHGANLFPESGQLIVSLYDDIESGDDRVTVVVHIGGPAVQDR